MKFTPCWTKELLSGIYNTNQYPGSFLHNKVQPTLQTKEFGQRLLFHVFPKATKVLSEQETYIIYVQKFLICRFVAVCQNKGFHNAIYRRY